MNHLGDTNKMVSDTPRTDGLLTEILDVYGYVHQGNCPERWVNHARELELELIAANERIKRLEEGGRELRECASQLGWTSSEEPRWLKRAEAAVETWDKEAKL